MQKYLQTSVTFQIDAKENDEKSCTVCVCCHPRAKKNKRVFLVPCLICYGFNYCEKKICIID